jgi:hypothetical protein
MHRYAFINNFLVVRFDIDIEHLLTVLLNLHGLRYLCKGISTRM